MAAYKTSHRRAKPTPLRDQLKEAGIDDVLRDARSWVKAKRRLSMKEVEEFCVAFLRDLRVARDLPSDAALGGTVKSLRKAGVNLARLMSALPRSFEVRIGAVPPLTGRDMVAAVRECADQLAYVQKSLIGCRRDDPVKREFRKRWTLFAKTKTGRSLPMIGERLYEMMFEVSLSPNSFQRMLRRDDSALKNERRSRTEDRKKHANCPPPA